MGRLGLRAPLFTSIGGLLGSLGPHLGPLAPILAFLFINCLTVVTPLGPICSTSFGGFW